MLPERLLNRMANHDRADALTTVIRIDAAEVRVRAITMMESVNNLHNLTIEREGVEHKRARLKKSVSAPPTEPGVTVVRQNATLTTRRLMPRVRLDSAAGAGRRAPNRATFRHRCPNRSIRKRGARDAEVYENRSAGPDVRVRLRVA